MPSLTSQQWLGFSIYLGFNSACRRSECERNGVDYEDTVAALTREGIIRQGRMNRKQAYEIFNQRFPGQIASQTHQVRHRLGI